MSIASRVIKNTGYLYAKMGITMFVSLYTTRLILNSLGASDFGIYNIVGGSISMLGFLSAAMASATQRFMSYSEGEGDKEKQKKIFNVSLILHFLIALIVGIILICAGFFFFNGILNIPESRIEAAKVVYMSLIISTMFTVMTVPYDATMNAHENMLYYAIIGIFEAVLKLLVAFICVVTEYDKLIVYGALMAGIPFISLCIMRFYCHKQYEECSINIRKYWDKSLMKQMTSFAGWNLIGSSSSMIGNYGIGIVLNHFYGTLLNAAQGVAGQLSGMLMTFSNNLLKALNPVISKSEGAGERERMILVTLSGSKFSFYILSLFAVPAIIEMSYILRLWLKNVPEWAVIFAQLQLVRSLIEQITITFGSALSAEGRIKNINLITSIINITPIVIIYILFLSGSSPILMYIINITFFGIVLSLVKLYFMNTHCGLGYKVFLKKLLMPILYSVLPSLLAGLIIYRLLPESFLRLVLTFFVCTCMSCLAIYYFGADLKEKAAINNIITKLINRLISI